MKKEEKPVLSIVVPVLNEEAILWENLSEVATSIDDIVGRGRWQFVIVDNGSSDNTPQIIETINQAWPPSYSIDENRQNYGAALRAGLEHADTPWVHTIDVEQWDIPFFKWSWQRRDKYDVFIGSKRADPTICHQPAYRWFLTWGLNAFLQLVFNFSGTETHGPKLLNKEVLRPILDKCFLDRGQYDTEIVLRSVRAGLRIVELPVSHSETRKPKNLMLKKIFFNLRGFYRLHRVMRDVPVEEPVRIRRFMREDVLDNTEG